MMRYSIFLCFLILMGCNSDDGSSKKENLMHFEEVGWTLSIPGNLPLMDSTELTRLHKKGQTAFEKTYDTEIDFAETKTLFAIKKSKLDYIDATITPFDIQKDGDWNENEKVAHDMTYETLQTQMPGITIDSSSTIETIAGKSFTRFFCKIIYPDKKTLLIDTYSALINGYSMSISLTYTDKKTEEEFMAFIRSSSFE